MESNPRITGGANASRKWHTEHHSHDSKTQAAAVQWSLVQGGGDAPVLERHIGSELVLFGYVGKNDWPFAGGAEQVAYGQETTEKPDSSKGKSHLTTKKVVIAVGGLLALFAIGIGSSLIACQFNKVNNLIPFTRHLNFG